MRTRISAVSPPTNRPHPSGAWRVDSRAQGPHPNLRLGTGGHPPTAYATSRPVPDRRPVVGSVTGRAGSGQEPSCKGPPDTLGSARGWRGAQSFARSGASRATGRQWSIGLPATVVGARRDRRTARADAKNAKQTRRGPLLPPDAEEKKEKTMNPGEPGRATAECLVQLAICDADVPLIPGTNVLQQYHSIVVSPHGTTFWCRSSTKPANTSVPPRRCTSPPGAWSWPPPRAARTGTWRRPLEITERTVGKRCRFAEQGPDGLLDVHPPNCGGEPPGPPYPVSAAGRMVNVPPCSGLTTRNARSSKVRMRRLA